MRIHRVYHACKFEQRECRCGCVCRHNSVDVVVSALVPNFAGLGLLPPIVKWNPRSQNLSSCLLPQALCCCSTAFLSFLQSNINRANRVSSHQDKHTDTLFPIIHEATYSTMQPVMVRLDYDHKLDFFLWKHCIPGAVRGVGDFWTRLYSPVSS